MAATSLSSFVFASPAPTKGNITSHREASVLARRHFDFQRLLVATESAAAQHQQAGQNAEDRQYQLELNRLVVFVRALREQLTELYGLADYNVGLGGGSGGGGMEVPLQALQGYGFRVDTLERGLLARQQEVRRLKARAAAAASAASRTEHQARQQQRQPPRASSTFEHSKTEKRGLAPKGGRVITEEEPQLDRDSQERVKREQEAQHALKGQLEDLVGALKASTLMVHSSLQQQNKVLDKTEDAAQRNLAGLQDELRKTEEQLKRSWSNSLTSCVMIALMLAIFVGTFLFMRLFPKRRWLLW